MEKTVEERLDELEEAVLDLGRAVTALIKIVDSAAEQVTTPKIVLPR